MRRKRRILRELRLKIRELERRARERELLAELGQFLGACQTTDEAYAVAARSASVLFRGDAGSLCEITTGRGGVLPIAAWGNPPPGQRVFATMECWALRRGRVHVVDDTSAGVLRCGHVAEPVGTGLLCVPLVAQGETVGLLHLQVRRRVRRKRRAALLADRERLAVVFGEQIALALANIRLRATLREQSSRDPLTGLFNRRYMEESLDRELRRATREEYSLGVIMADLDHLKAFNDAYGHAAGDMALQLVGTFLHGAVRGEDVACRFGGEEFVVILPKATLEDTRRRAEALRLGVASQRVEPRGPTLPAVTMSLGVAAFPDHGASAEALLQAADQALYRAKAAGRDRVAVAGSAEPRGIDVTTDPV